MDASPLLIAHKHTNTQTHKHTNTQTHTSRHQLQQASPSDAKKQLHRPFALIISLSEHACTWSQKQAPTSTIVRLSDDTKEGACRSTESTTTKRRRRRNNDGGQELQGRQREHRCPTSCVTLNPSIGHMDCRPTCTHEHHMLYSRKGFGASENIPATSTKMYRAKLKYLVDHGCPRRGKNNCPASPTLTRNTIHALNRLHDRPHAIYSKQYHKRRT